MLVLAELCGQQHATEAGLCCRQGKLQKLQQRLQEQNIDLQSQQQQVSSTEQVGRPVCLCLWPSSGLCELWVDDAACHGSCTLMCPLMLHVQLQQASLTASQESDIRPYAQMLHLAGERGCAEGGV